jgi:hypothetical protein
MFWRWRLAQGEKLGHAFIFTIFFVLIMARAITLDYDGKIEFTFGVVNWAVM